MSNFTAVPPYKPTTRNWVKLWVHEWLDGTTRLEMNGAQRAFWADLLALGGRSRTPGVICSGEVAGKTIGYPVIKLAALAMEEIDIEATLALFSTTGKITVEFQPGPPKLCVITITNWDKYQSEYHRQRKYRKGLQESDNSKNEKVTSKVTTEKTKRLHVEGEVEGEEEGEKKTQLPSFSLSADARPNAKRATSLPEQFELSRELSEYANKSGVPLPEREFEAFKDYHRAKGSTFKDWPAAWRTWCNNYVRFNGKRGGNGQAQTESFAERNIRKSEEARRRVESHLEEVDHPIRSALPSTGR